MEPKMIDTALLQPIPEPSTKLDPGSETLRLFSERLELLKKERPFPSLEQVQGGKEYLASCQAVQNVQQIVKEGWRSPNQMKAVCPEDSTNPDDKQTLEDANATVTLAQTNMAKAVEDCEAAAAVVLDSPELSTFLSANQQHDPKRIARLVQLVVLTQATPALLAEWCDAHAGDTNDPIAVSLARDLKQALLNHEATTDDAMMSLLLLFLESGGARKGHYGRALEIYHRLLTQDCTQRSSVLKRLALAVALELAEPYELFGNVGKTHPYRRFDHYARAYAQSALDPVTSRLNVWELRHVIDSDAPEDALEWGRTSLQNYRPDLVGSADPLWRYCQIVRTDVAYRNPTWYKEPRSYDQILSGGGKCGPRAW
jgi:hypothetical protein